MKKAKTIEDVYHIFDPSSPVTEEESELYVNIYKEDLRELENKLKFARDDGESFYIAGHRFL